METIKKSFKMSLGGRVVIDLEIEGDQDIIDAFTKQCITDSFGIFYKTKDEIMKFILNGLQVSAEIALRDSKGRYVNKEQLLKKTNLKVDTTLKTP